MEVRASRSGTKHGNQSVMSHAPL